MRAAVTPATPCLRGTTKSTYNLASSTWNGSAFPEPSSISGAYAYNAAHSEMVSLEKRRYAAIGNMGYAWYNFGDDALYFNTLTGYSPTLITLASFSARTDNGRVTVEWTTKSEIDNLGFNLYRSVNGGAEVKLNPDLIPGLISSVSGEQYTYSDASAPAGTPVCYTLEDIDLNGTKTSHGPACVYWPAPQGVVQEAAGVTGVTQGEGGTGIDRALVEGTGTEETTTGINTTAGSGRGRSSSGSAAPSPATSPPSPVTTSRVTAVTVSSLTARTDGLGVLISWKTGHEVNNLGFHVWREEGWTTYTADQGAPCRGSPDRGEHPRRCRPQL